MIDVRSDLYALIATAYHVVTGSIPTTLQGRDTIPSARQLNPTVSKQLDTILLRGLQPLASQRYQNPATLRQDLLMLHSMTGGLALRDKQSLDSSGVAQVFPSLGQKVPERTVQKLSSEFSYSVDQEQQYKSLCHT